MQKAYNIFLSHGGPYIGRYGSWFILIQHHFAAKQSVLIYCIGMLLVKSNQIKIIIIKECYLYNFLEQSLAPFKALGSNGQ